MNVGINDFPTFPLLLIPGVYAIQRTWQMSIGCTIPAIQWPCRELLETDGRTCGTLEPGVCRIRMLVIQQPSC